MKKRNLLIVFCIIIIVIISLIIVINDNKVIDKNSHNYLKNCVNNSKKALVRTGNNTAFESIKKVVLDSDNEFIDCVISTLELNELSKFDALQHIQDYITFHLKYKKDNVNEDTVSYPSSFILDGGGDCEDIATFSISIIRKLDKNIDISLIDVDSTTIGEMGHIAIALHKNTFDNNTKIKSIKTFYTKIDENIFNLYGLLSEEYFSYIPFDPPANDGGIKMNIGKGSLIYNYLNKNERAKWILNIKKIDY